MSFIESSFIVINHRFYCPLCLSISLSTSFPSVSFIMEKVDLVIVGAEGVAESGGIINKVDPLINPV